MRIDVYEHGAKVTAPDALAPQILADMLRLLADAYSARTMRQN